MNDPVRRLLGALVGGTVGVLAYWLMLRSGFLLLAAVGAGLGIGAGMFATSRSFAWGAAIAVAAVVLTVLTEWFFLPFAKDTSLSYFVSHLGSLPMRTQITLVVAAAMGFYFGMGREKP